MSITLSIQELTLEIFNFTEPTIPRKHEAPSGGFDEDDLFIPTNLWEFTGLLTPEEASMLRSIYERFLSLWQNFGACDVTVLDSAGDSFGYDGEFSAWFLKCPEYREEGIFVQATISLKEPRSSGWNDSLVIGGVTLHQRYLVDNKLPSKFAEGDCLDEKYRHGFAWEIVAIVTIAEFNALKTVYQNFINAKQSGGAAFVSVTDNTIVGLSSARAKFTKPLAWVSEKKAGQRRVRVTIGLKEVREEEDNDDFFSGTFGLSVSGASCTLLQKYFDDGKKFPHKYEDVSIDDYVTVPGSEWEVEAWLTKEEATALKAVYNAHIDLRSSGDLSEADVSIADGTFLGKSSSKAWFTKGITWSSQKDGDRKIKASFALRERDANSFDGWISVAGAGGAVTFQQRFLQTKYPRTTVPSTAPKVEYTINDATVLDGPLKPKYQWDITADCTEEEKNSILGIASSFGNSTPRSPLNLTDHTLGGGGSVFMTGFPKVEPVMKGGDRRYRITVQFQQIGSV